MFDKSKIESVYSGRKGCACGCRGKYSYASKYADQRPSYITEEGEWINDHTVNLITNKVEALLRDGENVSRIYVDDSYIAVDLYHDRTYTLYFAE